MFKKNAIDVNTLKVIASTVREAYDGDTWVIVVGGGDIARTYVKAARELGVDEATCDSIAVAVTRVNAYVLSSMLHDIAVQKIPTTVEELKTLASTSNGKIVVTGGMQPGQSTTAVSALAASVIKAERIIIATDVNGIYTEDPKKNPNAELLPKINYQQLEELLYKIPQKAGEYPIIDTVGLTMIKRTKIPIYYVNGHDQKTLKQAIQGINAGTIVTPD